MSEHSRSTAFECRQTADDDAARAFDGAAGPVVTDEDALNRAYEMLEAAADLANMGAWAVDVATGRVAWSKGMYRLYGLDERTAPSLELSLSFYDAEARQSLLTAVTEIATHGSSFDIELSRTKPDGTRVWIRSIGRSDPLDAQNRRLYGCMIDVTEHCRTQATVETLASRDTLTGVLNRRATTQAFEACRVAAARAGERVVVIVVDLDNFKEINDKHGHDAGDQVLREVAGILRGAIRSTDVIGRLSGDEFVIFTPSSNVEETSLEMSLRIFDRFHESKNIAKFGTPITPSIGVAEVDPGASDFSSALKTADLALDEAKTRGRRRAVIYDNDIHDRQSAGRSLFQDVERGLEAGEFTPAYQPKVDLVTGEIYGFEALARWQHPNRGELSPGAFWRALENRRLGAKISDAILAQVLQDTSALKRSGLKFERIAVNISEGQLLSDLFVETLRASCDRHGLTPLDLKFELTENILLSHETDLVRDRLETLADLGVMMAFDDFGTGYASLTHLLQFPIDRIKIDKSFILPLNDDPQARVITSAVIRMAHELGLKVVAEGIETRAVHDALCALECDFGQGYLYSRPVPFEQARALLNDQTIGPSA